MNTTELRRLLEKATPGNWWTDETNALGAYGIYATPDSDGHPQEMVCRAGYEISGDNVESRTADMHLIVETHNALPTLLTELDALRKRVAELERLFREARADAFEPKANQLAWRPAFDAQTEEMLAKAKCGAT